VRIQRYLGPKRLLQLIACLGALGTCDTKGAEDGLQAQWATLRIDANDHTELTNALAVSIDGKLVATGSQDGTLRFWSLPELKSVGKPIHMPVGKPTNLPAGGENHGEEIQGEFTLSLFRPTLGRWWRRVGLAVGKLETLPGVFTSSI
jgi:hypothetical protein